VELKRQRDTAEVEPIAYNGHLYDYDSKARDRIAAAIIALDVQGDGAKISWTTADNEDAEVTRTCALLSQRSPYAPIYCILHTARQRRRSKLPARQKK
uniref:DUF4376 domain-containing protein n=1 Tax=Phascolarctobacterium succinatutens TaxID=626940 RepID=UPI003A956BB4